MESAAECAAEYVRAPHKALGDLRDALARFEQAYDPTLVEDSWDNRTERWHETWRFSQNGRVNLTDMRVCERLKFVFLCVALARKREPELFGILVVAREQDELDLVSWISAFIRWPSQREGTFCLSSYPLWEFERKLAEFEFEIRTNNRFVNPSPTNATPPVAELASAGDGKSKTTPKVNAKGSQAEKLVSYLTMHHDYENGRVGNFHPAESADIASKSNAKPSTVSDFLGREFPSSGSPRDGYVAACKSQAALTHWLMVKHGDSLPTRTDNLEDYDSADIREKW